MKRFFVPIYKVLVLLFDDRKEYNGWRNKHNAHEISDTSVGHSNWIPDLDTALMFLPPEASLGTLAHECYHIAGFILESRGVCHGPDHHEAMAYLLGYLVNECNHRRSKKKKR